MAFNAFNTQAHVKLETIWMMHFFVKSVATYEEDFMF